LLFRFPFLSPHWLFIFIAKPHAPGALNPHQLAPDKYLPVAIAPLAPAVQGVAACGFVAAVVGHINLSTPSRQNIHN